MHARKHKPISPQKKSISTRFEEDVIADALDMDAPKYSVSTEHLLQRLWDANPALSDVLENADSLEQARNEVFSYLDGIERKIFDLDNPKHILENAIVRDAAKVFRSIIGPINEKRTNVSALDCLWKLATDQRNDLKWEVRDAFLREMLHLFMAVAGRSGVYSESNGLGRDVPEFLKLEGREAALKRTEQLDHQALVMRKCFERFPSGLDKEIISRRTANRRRILRYFRAGEGDWKNYRWHLKNVIKKPEVLFDLIECSSKLRHSVEKAVKARLPFGLTPYYLSLMDPHKEPGYDHAIRAQVLPPPDYVQAMVSNRNERDSVFDFMGEHDTSPVDLVTRRYPMICILKPFNTCAQICVYCQRNWEIDECMAPNASASKRTVDKALHWIAKHPGLGDVLITGGDPMLLKDDKLEHILATLSEMDHVYRIRIGTRTPVVLPMRWQPELVRLIAKYHKPGHREIAIITHFEHSYEITPEAMAAVQSIRRQGMSVYNQQVFTFENSRRFESVKLRKDVRSIGVDPYYTFNMKGKEETRRLMVPIARILQERKEEARLLPGLDRSDEPVFNVPKLGKNHLRAMQDHRLVMIKPDGSRVYEFHPWEKNIQAMPPYNYTDVPIHDYLGELAVRGEDVNEYKTIWYYY
jgi:lysine 2,3-aminomutase